MSVFQIHVLENEANIPSSSCWNSLWTLWSHLLLSSPKWQQAPLRQPAETLDASLGSLGCRTQTKSRSSHSSWLQEPSWGQRVEYETGGWKDIFGPKWTLFLKSTSVSSLSDAVAIQQGRDKVPPKEEVTPSLLWQTQLSSRVKAALMLAALTTFPAAFFYIISASLLAPSFLSACILVRDEDMAVLAPPWKVISLQQQPQEIFL